MKKTMAMISALALTASLVMPFTANAIEAYEPTQIKGWSGAWTAENFFEKTGAVKLSTAAALPESLTINQETYFIYSVSGSNLQYVIYNADGKKGNDGSGTIEFFKERFDDKKAVGYFTTGNVKVDKDMNAGATNVNYKLNATYIVTIPAKVSLSDTEDTNATIKAEKVVLAKGKNIVVKLTDAKNGAGKDTPGADKKFSAKTADGFSTAKYNISKGGTNIGLNDTVATFITQNPEQTSQLTFSKPTGATYAGDHIETLTFTISTEDAKLS